jgi:hypothetical protein
MGFCGRGKWLGFCTGLVVLAAAAPASATPTKPFSAVFTAGADASGLTVTAVLTNETTTQQLGSADLTAPPGYNLTGGGSVSPGTFSVAGNVVELRNLNLAPGQSATATIDIASSPCSASTWIVEAKQANNFSGLPGNDLTLDIAGSNLVTSLCGAPCPRNSSCGGTDASNGNGNASVVTGKGKLTGQLVESANANNAPDFTPLKCTGYTADDLNTYSLLAPSDRSKIATIKYKSAAMVPLQICFEAPYAFTGGTNIGTAQNPDYVGLLPDCTPGSAGPCLNVNQSSETPLGPHGTGPYDLVLVADIPAAPGDPRCG